MEQFFANFQQSFTDHDQLKMIQLVKEEAMLHVKNVNYLKNVFSCIDLTSLNTDDSSSGIRQFVDKVRDLTNQFSSVPDVAAVCVYPVFAPVLKSSLSDAKVKKAVVVGGFPSSQTFTDIKISEINKALAFGMDELDVVISVGEFLDGNYEFILEELRLMREASGHKLLKVIIETGVLKSKEEIWRASLLAMEGGADFIKTSSGKTPVSATPEAAFTMLQAIKSFYVQTGKKVGFKAAGGIVHSMDAIVYYCLVKEILGSDWLNNNFFRIGASRLANNLLSEIESIEKGQVVEVTYF